MNTIQPPWHGLQAPHALVPHISPTLYPVPSLLLITHCCKHHSSSAFSNMPSLFPAQSLCLCYSLCMENGGGGLVAKSSPTLATPWTVACQPPLSIRFPRQENWSGLPFPSPGDLTNLGIELGSPGKVHARRMVLANFQLHGSFLSLDSYLQGCFLPSPYLNFLPAWAPKLLPTTSPCLISFKTFIIIWCFLKLSHCHSLMGTGAPWGQKSPLCCSCCSRSCVEHIACAQ